MSISLILTCNVVHFNYLIIMILHVLCLFNFVTKKSNDRKLNKFSKKKIENDVAVVGKMRSSNWWGFIWIVTRSISLIILSMNKKRHRNLRFFFGNFVWLPGIFYNLGQLILFLKYIQSWPVISRPGKMGFIRTIESKFMNRIRFYIRIGKFENYQKTNLIWSEKYPNQNFNRK